ncbi:MAG: (deoxy)nucleoside triphosphate pyrophosphohydrolase [Mycobacteriales bacterium]
MRVSVVGAALLKDGRVLASRRTGPPHLAGYWEFPGGKVEEGESDLEALRRELAEELGVTAVVGERLGGDLLIGETAVLRVYVCTDVVGEPQLVDHDQHRWLAADELDAVRWIPVDAPLVEELRQLLGMSRTGPSGGADRAGPG